MAKLVAVQLETCHANHDGTAWYAYFEGKPTREELEQVFVDENLVDPAPLGWELDGPEEVPNALSRHAKLRRFYVAYAA